MKLRSQNTFSISRTASAAFGVLILLAGCSAAPDAESTSGTSADELSGFPPSICSGRTANGKIDDIPAYGYCSDFEVFSDDGKHTRKTGGTGWTQTEGGGGYQCVELAARWMHFKYEVPAHWGINYAREMCATHPSDVSKTSSPVHGDLMVFAPNECGHHAAGHVAVVDSVDGGKIHVVQQNQLPASETVDSSCASCFLHADLNNACGKLKDGEYCGKTKAFDDRGKEGTLYKCKDHEIAKRTVCGQGCVSISGANDICRPPPNHAVGEPSNPDDDTTDVPDTSDPTEI